MTAAHASHEDMPVPVRTRGPAGRPDGWRALCVCGWSGPVREHQAKTLRDQNAHEREMKERAA